MHEDVEFFTSQAHFRRWLARHHATTTALQVGFNKRGSGLGGLIYPEALDEALCFGWIDGVRKRIDDERFQIRFSPRKAKSTWSRVNINRMGELLALGVVQPAGQKAFDAREEARSGTYSYENRPREFEGAFAQRLKANAKASAFYQALPPGNRRTITWWVLSAKKDETREQRFLSLVERCERHERFGVLTPAPEKPSSNAKPTSNAKTKEKPAKATVTSTRARAAAKTTSGTRAKKR